MNISDFDYPLPDERIARFPLAERDASKLLVWRSNKCHSERAAGEEDSAEYHISETTFGNIGGVLPAGSLLVFNNTRVVRARLVFRKPTGEAAISGARIEILCLEPSAPADYERAFAAKGRCEWICMIGNLKRWKSGPVEIPFIYAGSEHILRAWRIGETGRGEQSVRFEWDADLAFGELLELLGRMPIPPYLGRDSEEIDLSRYQTVYSRIEGSVAAPTAGLHFTAGLIERLGTAGIDTDEVTLHVGAGTFLPVKAENALDHPMHTEHFEVSLATIEHLIAKIDHVIAVGTTSVRTLESLAALGWRTSQGGDPHVESPVGQFESYTIPAEFDGGQALEILAAWMRSRGLDRLKASTQIMITPAAGLPPLQNASAVCCDGRRAVDGRFRFRIVGGLVTNFHQPKSTLLLLIAAFTGGGREWRRIYDYALANNFRFLSYGDSSLLLR